MGCGAIIIRGDVRKSLSLVKAWSASAAQVKCSLVLSSLKNGRPFSPRCDMQWLKAAIHPDSFWTSLTQVGCFMLVIADTFLGFASMPQVLTMYPNRIPDGAPNMCQQQKAAGSHQHKQAKINHEE